MATEKFDKEAIKTEALLDEIEQLAFYHHRLGQRDVESLLAAMGDFLLTRNYGSENDFIIWVRSSAAVVHVGVSADAEGLSINGESFPAWQRLIDYFIESKQSIVYGADIMIKRSIDRQAWEFVSGQFEIDEEQILGKGAFGVVAKAKLNIGGNKESIIAVAKTLIGQSVGDSDRKSVLAEMRILRLVGFHPNVVRFLGVSIDIENPILFFEFMSGGDLKRRLVDKRQKECLLKTKIRIALDVAVAMKHLNGLGIVHRDLSARNVLFDSSSVDIDLIGAAKLADFGRSRKLDSTGKYLSTAVDETRIPFLWTAPESLQQWIWTSASEVWSFGCFLYELLSNGAEPYWNYDGELGTKEQLLAALNGGLRLKFPNDTPGVVCQLSDKCFDTEPRNRPSADDLIKGLHDILMNIKS